MAGAPNYDPHAPQHTSNVGGASVARNQTVDVGVEVSVDKPTVTACRRGLRHGPSVNRKLLAHPTGGVAISKRRVWRRSVRVNLWSNMDQWRASDPLDRYASELVGTAIKLADKAMGSDSDRTKLELAATEICYFLIEIAQRTAASNHN